MQERAEWAPFEQAIAAALRDQPATWTPNCLEPEELLALVKQEGDTPAPPCLAHVASCAYCRRHYAQMLETWQLAAEVQRLESAASPPEAAVALRDGGGRVTLDEQGRLGGLPPVPPSLLRAIQSALKAGRVPPPRQMVAALVGHQVVFRGEADGEGTFSLFEPVGTALLEDQPAFTWAPAPGAARYKVCVAPDNGDETVVIESVVRATAWTPPERLPRGEILRWEVTALDQDGKEVAYAPKPPVPKARFTILEPARAMKLERARRAYADAHLTLGVLYAKAGLLQAAETEFAALSAANPGSAVARELLASVRALRPKPRKQPENSAE